MHNQESKIPFLNTITLISNLFAMAVFFGTLGLAGALLPVYWKRVKNAVTLRERAYFAMQFTTMWCIVYVLGMILLFVIDAVFFQSELDTWWPTISFTFMDWNMSHQTSVYCDLMWSVVLAAGTAFGSKLLGSEDSLHGDFRAPETNQRTNHIADVMARYRAVLETDPRKVATFKDLKWAEKKKLVDAYQERLEDITHRVREVHRTWGKVSPVD
jgi:hypothetical protein